MLKFKMLRDIKLNLSQFITIFLMTCIGIMAYSGIESYMAGMEKTADKFYSENNLYDLNLMGENFTNEDLEKVKDIEHVKNAERKLEIKTNVDKETTLLTSFIETNDISKLYVVEGEEFNPNKKGTWLDEYFAKAHDIKVGDEISFKYDGYTFNEKVLGTINVPDHIYDVKDESELFPNHNEYGFIYLSIIELEDFIKAKAINEMGVTNEVLEQTNFNYKDKIIYNNLMVDVDKKENVNKVKANIEENIKSAMATVKAEDIASYRSYVGEINEGKTYVGVFSGLFIFIAMLSVVTTMTRMVKSQQNQIGTLKALGFSNGKILIHYMSYGFWISIFAGILGLILGYNIIGRLFMKLEMDYFLIPNGKPHMVDKSYVCVGIVVLLIVLASYITCRKILKMNAAESLRNEIPNVKNFKNDITTKEIFNKMSFSTKWNLRDMLRNKLRTLTGIVGIAACTMLIVCAFGMLDTMNNFIKLQFEELYNFKYKLILEENISKESIQELTEKYGNSTTKTSIIEIKDKNEKKMNNALILDDNENRIRFQDDKGNYIKLNSDKGIYVTYKLAENEGYKLGDILEWHEVGSDVYHKSKIIGFNKDPQNQNITMSKKYYESLENTYTPDSLYVNEDLSKVKEIENVNYIQSIESIKSNMSQLLNTMKSMITLIIVIAVILGVVIIYNMGILSYSEKHYQFATLKVLGFQDNQIKKIFIKQNNIISAIAIILGLPLGFLLVSFIFKFALEENYDFPAHVRFLTYLIATLGTYLVSFIVSKKIAKKVSTIDMVSSLKGNE